jgi:hypothetical protein
MEFSADRALASSKCPRNLCDISLIGMHQQQALLFTHGKIETRVINTIAVARDGIVYAGTQAGGAAMSRDEGTTWQRLNSRLADLEVRCIIVAGGGVFAMTAQCVVRLQTQ